MTPIPPLPQETLEEIVDFLYDDRATLFACSLASSKFVSVSRYHLFSKVTLVSTRMCRFLELVDTPYSTLANVVSRIIFTGTDLTKTPMCQWKMRCEARARRLGLKAGTYTEYLPEDFSIVRENFKSVTSIRLTDLSSVDIPENFWRLLFEMKAIKTLEVNRIAFEECPIRLFGYISSLPLLETLSISRATMMIDSSRLTSLRQRIGGGDDSLRLKVGPGFRMHLLDFRKSNPLPNQERNLSTSTIAGIAVLEWLLAQSPMPLVDVLRMSVDCEQELGNMLARYFVGAGSSIQKLSVTLPVSISSLQNATVIDYSPLTQVRWLHIDGLYMSHSASGRALEVFFRGFFAQLFSSYNSSSAETPPPLEKLSITLTVDAKADHSFYGMPDYAVLQPFTWCSLPSIVEQALEFAPAKLKTVEVQLRVRSSGITEKHTEFAEECVRAGVWKRFNDSGRLRVRFLPLLEKDGDLDGV